MQFHIGPWIYSVRISDGQLFDQDHIEQPGLCIWLENVIEISGVIPLERRLDVLLHELRHAWRHHLGRAVGDEDDANNAASFTKMVVEELVSQGGEKALMALKPVAADAPVGAGESANASPTSTRTWAQSSPDGGTECGCCGRRFSPGEIVTGAPDFHPLSGKMIIPRGVYCEGCNHVLEWHEGTLFDLSPNGQVIGGLRIMRGADATDWLRRHGEQAGVMVA